MALAFVIGPFVVGAAPQDLRLVDAAKRNDPKTAATLIKQGVNVSTPQLDGATPLHWAAHWDDLRPRFSFARGEGERRRVMALLEVPERSRAMVDRSAPGAAQRRPANRRDDGGAPAMATS
jgi:hypothetical protein